MSGLRSYLHAALRLDHAQHRAGLVVGAEAFVQRRSKDRDRRPCLASSARRDRPPSQCKADVLVRELRHEAGLEIASQRLARQPGRERTVPRHRVLNTPIMVSRSRFALRPATSASIDAALMQATSALLISLSPTPRHGAADVQLVAHRREHGPRALDVRGVAAGHQRKRAGDRRFERLADRAFHELDTALGGLGRKGRSWSRAKLCSISIASAPGRITARRPSGAASTAI